MPRVLSRSWSLIHQKHGGICTARPDKASHILLVLDSTDLDIRVLPKGEVLREGSKLLATDLVAKYGTVIENGEVIQIAEKIIVPAEWSSECLRQNADLPTGPWEYR